MVSELVQVSQILGALECTFATALVKENKVGNFPSLAGQIAYGTLSLNVVYKRSADFGISGRAAHPHRSPTHRLVGTLLAMEVALAVAPRTGRITRAVFRPEALHACPGIDQRAVD